MELNWIQKMAKQSKKKLRLFVVIGGRICGVIRSELTNPVNGARGSIEVLPVCGNAPRMEDKEGNCT